MHLYTDSIDGLREAVCRTGERLSAVELANDAEAYLQRMQEARARNTFQAKRTANLQHGIEPPLGPTLKEAAPEQDAVRPAPPRRILEPGDAARLAELRRQAMDRPQRPDRYAPRVLKPVGEGQSYREISHRLGLSKNTILDNGTGDVGRQQPATHQIDYCPITATETARCPRAACQPGDFSTSDRIASDAAAAM
jgi:hypothetical protein